MFHDNKLKSGFTLVELMVFFVFITLLLAASTPLITKRVKSLPARVYHGTFVCYRGDDGQLRQEYYNTVRRVSSEAVAECRFEPPKRAKLYKVTMVGGGAGGYDFVGSRTVEEDDRNGRYDIGRGFACYGGSSMSTCSYDHAAPTGQQLRNIFEGQKFTEKALVRGAGNGEYLTVTYTPLNDIQFQVKDNESAYIKDLLGSKEHLPSKCNDINITLSEDEKAICTLDAEQREAAKGKRNEIILAVANCGIEGGSCYATAGQNNLKAIDEKMTYSYAAASKTGAVKTAEGGSGGKGGYIVYYGTIDLIDHSKGISPIAHYVANDEIDSYLKSLKTHISSGAMSTTADYAVCSDFTSNYSYPNMSSTGNWKSGSYSGATPVHESSKGEKGSDVYWYDAIKVWEHCVSVLNTATGGEGARIDIENSNPEHFVLYRGQNGTDASGLEGHVHTATYLGDGHSFAFTTSGASKYPHMEILTTLSQVSYRLGQHGTAGETKTFFVSDLRDDCEFTVPAGGPALDENDIAATMSYYEENLYTSLSCNDHTIEHSVRGGTYTMGLETITHSQWEHMADYKKYLDSGSLDTPPSYESRFEAGLRGKIESDYNADRESRIFSKVTGSDHSFGAGGSGPVIYDGCMTPTGVYSHSLYDQNGQHVYSKDKQYNLPAVKCDANEQIRKIDAQDGESGAIIITW